MVHQVKSFKGLFVELFQKGLPPFWDEDGKLISQYEYQALLVKVRLDHKKFQDMTKSLSRKFIVDKMVVDFEFINSFRTIGT